MFSDDLESHAGSQGRTAALAVVVSVKTSLHAILRGAIVVCCLVFSAFVLWAQRQNIGNDETVDDFIPNRESWIRISPVVWIVRGGLFPRLLFLLLSCQRKTHADLNACGSATVCRLPAPASITPAAVFRVSVLVKRNECDLYGSRPAVERDQCISAIFQLSLRGLLAEHDNRRRQSACRRSVYPHVRYPAILLWVLILKPWALILSRASPY